MTIEHTEEDGLIPDVLPADLSERVMRVDITGSEKKALLSLLSSVYEEDITKTAARAIGTAVGFEKGLLSGGGKIVRADFMGDRVVSSDDVTSLDDAIEVDEEMVESIVVPPLDLTAEFGDYLMHKANRLRIDVREAFDRIFTFGLKVNYELSFADKVSYLITDSKGNYGHLQSIDHGDNVVGQFFQTEDTIS